MSSPLNVYYYKQTSYFVKNNGHYRVKKKCPALLQSRVIVRVLAQTLLNKSESTESGSFVHFCAFFLL